MYGKFFESTFTGSMLGAGPEVISVWAYIIAHAKNGQVEINPKLVAFSIGMSVESVQGAIEYLCAPDPQSRNKDHDGARLVKEGELAYIVVSHDKYKNMRTADERREYNRIKKRESREKLRNNKGRSNKSKMSKMSTLSAKTEAEAEADVKTSMSTPAGPGLDGASVSSKVATVFEHWRAVMGKNGATKLNAKRRRAIEARLREGYTVEDVRKAINGCRSSRFHMGNNKNQKPYNDIELICRDGAKLESFWDKPSASHQGHGGMAPIGAPEDF